MICSFIFYQKNYLNAMSMTMSFSHIPSSSVASDSFNKGTRKDLKGKKKNEQKNFIQML